MSDSHVHTTMWRHGRWRCEYQQTDETGGLLTVYAGDEPVLEQRCHMGQDCNQRADAFHALVIACRARERAPGDVN
jgi:hypothetical protein